MLNSELVQTLNAGMVDGELITPDRLYLDWGLFRDPYIGAAISLLMSAPDQSKSAQAFVQLQNRIPDYQQREFNDVAHYMPELGFTADDILNRLADLTQHVTIFFAAPFTCFIQILYGNLKVNINHSGVKGKFTKVPVGVGKYQRDYDPIRLSINTYPLVLQKRQQDLIGAFFVGNYQVDVEILSIAPKLLPLEFLLQMDEIYTNHLVDLLANEPFSQALTDMKFSHKRIFAVKQLGSRRPPKIKSSAIKAEFLRLGVMLDVMTNFAWIDPSMLPYELYPPPTPTSP